MEQAIRNALDRVPRAKSYLDHDHLELDNAAAEQAPEPVSIGRENWMFIGSEGGGQAMAIAFTLIETAKLNGVDPQSLMRWGLGHIADHTTPTRLCLGVTPHRQGNRARQRYTSAPSPNTHRRKRSKT